MSLPSPTHNVCSVSPSTANTHRSTRWLCEVLHTHGQSRSECAALSFPAASHHLISVLSVMRITLTINHLGGLEGASDSARLL